MIGYSLGAGGCVGQMFPRNDDGTYQEWLVRAVQSALTVEEAQGTIQDACALLDAVEAAGNAAGKSWLIEVTEPDMIGNLPNEEPGPDGLDDRTPAEWLQTPRFRGWSIKDADGWQDGTWEQSISLHEFIRRLNECTIQLDLGIATEVAEAAARRRADMITVRAARGGIASVDYPRFGFVGSIVGDTELGRMLPGPPGENYWVRQTNNALADLNNMLGLVASDGIEAEIEVVDVTEAQSPVTRKRLAVKFKKHVGSA